MTIHISKSTDESLPFDDAHYRSPWRDHVIKYVLRSNPTPVNEREVSEILSKLATELAKLREWDRYDLPYPASATAKRYYREVAELKHTSAVETVDALPDGRIISGSTDHIVRVWSEGTDGEWIDQELTAHASAISVVQGPPDGRIVSGSVDGFVCLWTERADGWGWDAESTIHLSDGPEHLQALPDGRFITALSNGRLLILQWTPDGGWDQRVIGEQSRISSLQVLPYGTIVTAHENCCVSFWSEGESGRWSETMKWVSNTFLESLTVLADGRVFVGDFHGRIFELAPQDHGGYDSSPIGEHGNIVSCLQALPDGRIACGGDTSEIAILEGTSLGTWRKESVEAGGPALQLRLLADGRLISATGNNLAVRVYDGDPVGGGGAS